MKDRHSLGHKAYKDDIFLEKDLFVKGRKGLTGSSGPKSQDNLTEGNIN